MEIGVDFKFRDDKKADTVPVELIGEPYNGIVFRFTSVAIKEEVGQSATIKFDYELFESVEHTMIGLRKDKKFNEHIGLVLNSMILEAIDAADNGTSNITKPTA